MRFRFSVIGCWVVNVEKSKSKFVYLYVDIQIYIYIYIYQFIYFTLLLLHCFHLKVFRVLWFGHQFIKWNRKVYFSKKKILISQKSSTSIITLSRNVFYFMMMFCICQSFGQYVDIILKTLETPAPLSTVLLILNFHLLPQNKMKFIYPIFLPQL